MSEHDDALAIETVGLVKTFGTTRAVDGIDLAVRAGTVYGVLGPNGAGKTTTIRMLATLLRPDAGQAWVLGHDVVAEADAVRSSVSLTGQFASVDEELSGRENLVLLGRLLGWGRRAAGERASELLEAFGLTDAGDRLVKEYSGGMRRRLDIAASIVVTPELLFLDEPTTGLDPRSRNQVWEIVRVLVAEGTTVLLTTQYLDEADQLAGRIAIIDHGRVIAEGTPGELKAMVGTGTLHVRLHDLQQRAAAARVLSEVLGDAPHPDADPAALTVRASDPERVGAALRELSRAGIAVAELLPRPAQPGRGVPDPHRARGRDAPRRGGRRMTMAETPPAFVEATLRSALATRARPHRATATAASLSFAWRAMLKIKHLPMQLFDVTAFPIMFVVLYTYLFGGALAGSPQKYLQQLLPGILVMTVSWITMYTGQALNTDIGRGVFDRFRSLPIWRPAVLVGMLLADTVRYTLASTVVIALGVALGFRPGGGPLGVVLAVALLLVFSFSLSWVWTALGLRLPTPEAVMQVSMTILFPLTFASNVFVNPATMPGWVQAFVDVNPISHLATAARGLMHGTAAAGDVGWVLLWSVALVAIFAPLTMRLYNRER